MLISNILISIGIVMAAAGMGGLMYCIRLARRVQAKEFPDDQLQGVFIKISAVNMASMGGAMLGLAMVLVGLII